MTQRVDPFKRTLVIFAAFVVSAIIGYWVIGAQLLAPARAAIEMPQDGLDVEDIRIEQSDGPALAAWLAGDAAPRAVVVLMHPLLGNRTTMLGRARFLVQAGHAVLMFDFRGHGDSDGGRISYGLREARDVMAAVAFARQRFPGVPLIAHGVSLGGAASLIAGPALDVDGLILESVFPDLTTAVSNRLRMRLGAMGMSLAPLFAHQLAWRLDAQAGDFRTFVRATEISSPVFVIAASNDRRVAATRTLRFYEALVARKSIWLVGGAVHQDLHWYATEDYERRVLRFVDRVARQAH